MTLEKKKLPTLREVLENIHAPTDNQDYYSKESKALDLAKKRAENEGLIDYFKARKEFAKKIFWFVVSWFVFIAIIVSLAGFKLVSLSDSVLITLITTTTINVCAFLIIVAKFLFPPTNNELLN